MTPAHTPTFALRRRRRPSKSANLDTRKRAPAHRAQRSPATPAMPTTRTTPAASSRRRQARRQIPGSSLITRPVCYHKETTGQIRPLAASFSFRTPTMTRRLLTAIAVLSVTVVFVLPAAGQRRRRAGCRPRAAARARSVPAQQRLLLLRAGERARARRRRLARRRSQRRLQHLRQVALDQPQPRGRHRAQNGRANAGADPHGRGPVDLPRRRRDPPDDVHARTAASARTSKSASPCRSRRSAAARPTPSSSTSTPPPPRRQPARGHAAQSRDRLPPHGRQDLPSRASRRQSPRRHRAVREVRAPRSKIPDLSLSAQGAPLEFPTGSAQTLDGSGSLDGGVQLLATRDYGHSRVHASAGVLFLGHNGPLGTKSQFVITDSIGVSPNSRRAAPRRRVQVNISQSPFRRSARRS